MHLLFPAHQQTYSVDSLRVGVPTEAAFSENDLAALQFCYEWLNGQQLFTLQTSGSTGTPKAIHLTRRQMEASARATGAALGLHPGINALVCLPTRYIAGRMMLVRGLVLDLNLIVVEPSANPLAGLPEDMPIDFAAFTPMQMQQILVACEGSANLQSKIQNPKSRILLGGAPVSVSLEEAVQGLSSAIYHTYGMTETVSHIALRRLNGSERSDAFVPLPGVQLGLDERGCLNICAEVTQGELIQTNDMVDLRADGSFVWLGRWDNVINSGGVKVQVERIEDALERLGDWEIGRLGRRFFVAGLPDQRLGQIVTLVVESQPFSKPVEEAMLAQLHTELEQRLGAYQSPRRIVYVTAFSETPTGKIDRKATLTHIQ